MTEEEILNKITLVENRLSRVEMSQNDQLIKMDAIKTDTSEIIELFHTLSGFWKVIEFFGKLAAPLTVLAAAFAAWFTVKKL